MTPMTLSTMSLARPAVAANARRFDPWTSTPATCRPAAPPTSDERAVGAVIAALMQAIRVRNADALVALCAADAACYDMTPLQGPGAADGVRAHWSETWEAFDGEIGCDATQRQITLGADVAFARSLLRLSGRQADGVRRTHWVCATFGLRRSEGVWRFVHQHYSQPFERAAAPAAPAAVESVAAHAASTSLAAV